MNTKEIEEELSLLQLSVPGRKKGKKPRDKEIAARRAQKQKIRALLEQLPPERRSLYNTSGERTDFAPITQHKKTKITKAPNVAQSQNAAGPTSIGIDYLCILDFEATCSNIKPQPNPQEIIEFPTLLFNVRTGQVEEVFHYYIKPEVHPKLTPFCTELTGITQDMVDEGIPILQALQLHREWLDSLGLVPAFAPDNETAAPVAEHQPQPKSFLYLTCGSWDLQTCLPFLLRYYKQKVPLPFQGWMNVKHEFEYLYGQKAGGMTGMLDALGMELEGRHHSGIDDCRNIARICERMIQDGWKVKI